MKIKKGPVLACLDAVITAVFIILMAAVVVFLNGCKTIKEVPVKVTETQIEYRDRYLRDSILTHDSTVIYMKGDTQYIYRDRFQYRDRYLHDTICKVDSVPYTVYVTEKEELGDFDKIKIKLGGYAILLLIILLFVCIAKFVRKFMK